MTPVIRALRKNFPDSKITYIANPWVKDLIKFLPEIDNELYFKLSQKENLFSKIVKGFKLIYLLRKQKFDLVFLGHRTNFLGLILRLSGIKYRMGFSETKFMNISSGYDEAFHEANRYLKIFRDNGYNVDSNKIVLKRISEKKELREKLNISENDIVLGVFPFGGINPGTDMDIKRWESVKYNELIKKLNSVYSDIKILVFKGTEKNEMLNNLSGNINVIKLKINIESIQLCDLFISGDTGPLHIASAFDICTLAVFGPTDPGQYSTGYLEKDSKSVHEIIWHKIECSPCYTPATSINRKNKLYWKNGSFICYKGHHNCIREITVEEVFNKSREIINQIRIK